MAGANILWPGEQVTHSHFRKDSEYEEEVVPPYHLIIDWDFDTNTLRSLALGPDDFIHPTRVSVLCVLPSKPNTDCLAEKFLEFRKPSLVSANLPRRFPFAKTERRERASRFSDVPLDRMQAIAAIR